MPTATSTAAEDDCPECRDQKEQADARSKATGDDDGLQLGECAPLYKLWAECVERERGQAKACTAVLKEFKECHRKGTERALERALPKSR